MLNPLTAPTPRRTFLVRAAALGAALSGALPLRLGALAPGAALAAATAGTGPDPDVTDRWLQGLNGKHRQLFDMPEPEQGLCLLHIRNYLETWKSAYKMPDNQVNAIGTFYGKTIPLGLSDAMWAKYPLGAAIEAKDANGAPLTRNMFNDPQPGDPFAYGFFDSSIKALQARGTRFVLCNNALTIWSGMIAKKANADQKAVYEELASNMLPGVILIPGMVVAINKAQEHGFSYMRL
jgi:intracellular sulfur oxidation DsrE/DsrF family protein